MNIEIFYEDNDIIVCRKPAGFPTQTKRLGSQDMESYLRNYRARKKEDSYIGVIHRLDQPVEGVMVFAKNHFAASELSKQLSNHLFGKHYYAILWSRDGQLPKQGQLTDYILTDKKTNTSKVVPKNTPQSKQAILNYTITCQYEDRAILDIKLETGRQHQIRLQFASRMCPLLGDHKYGNPSDGYNHVALFSYALDFCHPTTKKEMHFEIPVNFASYLDIRF